MSLRRGAPPWTNRPILIEQTLPAPGAYYSPMSGASRNMGQTRAQARGSEFAVAVCSAVWAGNAAQPREGHVM